jgi:hypothetical protein
MRRDSSRVGPSFVLERFHAPLAGRPSNQAEAVWASHFSRLSVRRLAKSGPVHDQQDVRRVLRRGDARRPCGLGLRGVEFDQAPEFLRWRRQIATVDRDRAVRGARDASDRRPVRLDGRADLLRARIRRAEERRGGRGDQ